MKLTLFFNNSVKSGTYSERQEPKGNPGIRRLAEPPSALEMGH